MTPRLPFSPWLSHPFLKRNMELEGMGLETFGSQEFVRYPVIGVNQPTSEAKPEGKFQNRATGEIYDTLDVVFLALRRSMAYRPGGYTDALPACYSSNALQPDPSVEQPVHHTCHRLTPRGLLPECPHARWLRSSEGRPSRACNLRYTAALDFQGRDHILYFQGRSIPPLERFLSQLRQMQQPLFSFRVRLSLLYRTRREGFLGNFYEIAFPDLNDPSSVEIASLVQASDFKDRALFFKDYLDTAPSDLYHGFETEPDVSFGTSTHEGVLYASSPPAETASIRQRWGQTRGGS